MRSACKSGDISHRACIEVPIEAIYRLDEFPSPTGGPDREASSALRITMDGIMKQNETGKLVGGGRVGGLERDREGERRVQQVPLKQTTFEAPHTVSREPEAHMARSASTPKIVIIDAVPIRTVARPQPNLY